MGVPVIGCECDVCRSRDPRNRRTRSALSIQESGTTVVIDTPPEFRLQALRCGLKRVDAVLFTHLHADHIFGFDDLRRFNQLQADRIPVYGSRETIEGLRRSFAYVFEPPQQPGISKPAVETHILEGPVQIGPLSVTPVPVLHGSLPITGYRVGPLAYLTDCSHIPESSLAQLEGLEVLVIGALRYRPHPTHFSIPQALEVVQRLKPRLAFLTHLSHEVDHRTAPRQLPPNVRLAYDGLELDI